MKKVLIATHGKFASGIVNTIAMLIGEKQELSFIDAYTDDSDFTVEAEAYLKENQGNDIIVFTDLYGGSVNQKFSQLKSKYSFHLISGFNLSLVLSILLDDDPLSPSSIEAFIKESREGMKLISLEKNSVSSDDFFDA